MQVIKACVSERLLQKATRLFTGTLDGRVIEILQLSLIHISEPTRPY